MAGITLGRITLPRTSTVDIDGRTVEISGSMQSTTLLAATVLRQQLVNMGDNPDEPVVPVTWSEDSSVNGFYRVVSSGVQLDRERSLRGSYHHLWDVVLEQVPGWNAPLVESTIVGAVRTNSHSLTSTDTRPWHAVPNTAEGYTEYFSGQSSRTIAAADGSTIRHYDGGASTGEDHYFDAAPQFYLPAADWYDAACSIQITDQVVVGTQWLSDPADWLLSNELVKVEPGASAGQFKVSHWDGSAWDAVTYTLGLFATPWAALTVAPHAIRVLRNGPEMAGIRLAYTGMDIGTITEDWSYTLDLSVRRGARYIEGLFIGSGPLGQWGVGRTATEAATALTGGIRATANDAAGNKFVLASPRATTNDLTEGRIYATSALAGSYPFMVGCDVGGAASLPLSSQGLIYEYMAVQGEVQRVTSR